MILRTAKVWGALLVCVVVGQAQQAAEQTSPAAPQPSGFRVNSISVFSGYSSLALPGGAAGYLYNFAPLGWDVEYGGSANLQWARHGRRTNVSLTYDISYTGQVRYSQWNALNSGLSFSVNRNLSQKWNLAVGVNGSANSLSEFLFTPTGFSQVTATGASSGDLAGQLANAPLPAIPTGAPVAESPASTLIYGQRVLSGTASVSLSYASSTKWTFHLRADAIRAQYLNSGQNPLAAGYGGIVPQTTAGGAGAGVSYRLTPRTEINVDASSNRTVSRYEDAYIANGRVTLGRRMSRRWFFNAYGGMGKIVPVRANFVVLSGHPQYTAGGNVGFRTRSHNFLVSVDRSVADSYGLGAGRTLSSGGSWTWRRPGSGWRFSTAGSWQKLAGGIDLASWTVRQQIVRDLSRHIAAEAQYAYMNGSSSLTGFRQQISVHSVRLCFVWMPSGERRD